MLTDYFVSHGLSLFASGWSQHFLILRIPLFGLCIPPLIQAF